MTMRYTHLSTPDIEAAAMRIAAIIAGQLEGQNRARSHPACLKRSLPSIILHNMRIQKEFYGIWVRFYLLVMLD
ncbi:MAG: hypothetical protein ACNYPF_04945 [Candidatus Puniceispirillales bacterium WSBS_2018_MAG_OTU23]